jgi:2-octaprenylphenol hydroxylase
MRQTQSNTFYEAVIVGGGMVGLACAKGLADQGMKVAVIEPSPISFNWDDQYYGSKVSAINRFSELFLKQLNAWAGIISERVSPYHHMYVWDACGGGDITLRAGDVGETELGYIIENRVIIKALWDLLEHSAVDLYTEDYLANVESANDHWHLFFHHHRSIKTRLIIGSDGGNSWVRQYFNIPTDIKSYDQSAIVATIYTEKSHKHTAWQVFQKDGPLAYLPLSHPNYCSIVYSQATSKAHWLYPLNEEAFNEALDKHFISKLGHSKIVSERFCFPLYERHAQSYTIEGVALLGDAAHTIHPLAGQGVNIGFKDAEQLIQTLTQAKAKGRQIDHQSTLEAYERHRRWANQAMICSMRGFKNVFSNDCIGLKQWRSKGLNMVDDRPIIKRAFIHQAMGVDKL